jgi:hypothetical protein
MRKPDKAEKQVTTIREQDFADRRYQVLWEGCDPIYETVSDVKRVKELIENWAMGKVPDKTVAIEALRVLAEVIENLRGIDRELTGIDKPDFS